MWSVLEGLLAPRATGFVLVEHDEDGAMRDARPGARLGTRGPPWIVVLERAEDAIVTAWPGRLWRVRVARRGREQPAAHARYVRADVVDVLEEAPRALLFGRHGEKICAVLDVAAALTLEQAQRLADALPDEARATYERVWNRWLGAHGEHALRREDGLVLASGSHDSPVGGGLMAVHGIVFKRAKQVSGDAAWHAEDDEVVIDPPWDRAGTALVCAALAASELCTEEDAALLTAALSHLQQ